MLAHLLTLSQTLLVAQVGLGLLLLSDHRRASDQAPLRVRDVRAAGGAHPVVLRARDPRKRLAWFAGSTFVAAALAVRAYTTA